MDAAQFDTLARSVVGRQGRRRFAQLLGGMAAMPLLGNEVDAGKKKPKKKPLCLNGQTIKAAGKKRKKLMKQGAKAGVCGPCDCPPNTVCNGGVCTPCTLTCTETPIGCGSRLALALANGGTIVACPGIYAGNFTVSKTTTLIGAGSGDDPATSTILDAQGTNRVVTVNGGITFSGRGLRLRGGNTTGDGGGIRGAGESDVRLANCAVTNNNSANFGGGASIGGVFSMENCVVAGNAAAKGGGGIDFYPASGFIINSTITGNRSGADGGGLYFFNSQVTITGTDIESNETVGEGGGIFADGSPTNVTLDSAVSISGNTATVAGGGIYRSDGTVTLNGAKITNNGSSNCAGSGGFSCPG